MTMIPESEVRAKFLTDTGEKRGEILAKDFADFRPSISRKSGRKKFHEKSSTFPRGTKQVLSRRDSESGSAQEFCKRCSSHGCLLWQ